MIYADHTVRFWTLKAVFHWAEVSARKDNFFCLLTPILASWSLNKRKFRSAGKIPPNGKRSPCCKMVSDPFTERQKLVRNGGFPKFDVLYRSQNIVKSIKIQWNLSYELQSSTSKTLPMNWKVETVFGRICHYGPAAYCYARSHRKHICSLRLKFKQPDIDYYAKDGGSGAVWTFM